MSAIMWSTSLRGVILAAIEIVGADRGAEGVHGDRLGAQAGVEGAGREHADQVADLRLGEVARNDAVGADLAQQVRRRPGDL